MLRQSSKEQRFLLHHIYSFNILWRVLWETRCSPHAQIYIYVRTGSLSTLTIWVSLERIVSQPDGYVMDDIWTNKTGKEKNLCPWTLPHLWVFMQHKKKETHKFVYYFSIGSHLDILSSNPTSFWDMNLTYYPYI